MNIFYLGYSLEEGAGGIENYTYIVLKHLQDKGHNIVIYTINGNNKKFENIEFTKNKYFDRFFLGKRVVNNLYKKHKKIDLFLCGHLFLAKHMEKIVNKYDSNYNLFVYGIDCWAGRFEERQPKLKSINKIISISSFTTKQIKNQGFRGDVVYLPPVLDENKFPLIQKEVNADNTVKFITVGRLSSAEKYKGHDKVIEAVNLLVNKYNIKNIEYRIIGKGDDKERLENKVRELNLESFIKFYGFVPDEDLPKVYSSSDVFIMPSNVSLDPSKPEGEGFGIVFTEAAMYKLPMIGPNDGGSTDIIDDNINGLECDPLSPSDIAEKMKILINNEKKRIEFGKKANEKIVDNFTLRQLDGYLEKIVEM